MRSTQFQQGSQADYMALTDEVLMLREKILRAREFQVPGSPEFLLCESALEAIDHAYKCIFSLEKIKTAAVERKAS